RIASICCGVALSPASAAAGSAGTTRISRKVTISRPNSDGIAVRPRRSMNLTTAGSAGEAHPAHLAAAADRAVMDAPDAVGDPGELDRVVNPDVRAVGDHLPDRVLIKRRPLRLVGERAGLAQQRVDLVVLIPGRRLPGAVELAVVH